MRNNLLLLTVITTLLFSCGLNTKHNKVLLDLKTVDSIVITQYQETNHTIVHKLIKLTDSEVNKFINLWNDSEYKGSCKFRVKHKVIVYLRDKKIRTFRINERNIKENDDSCYDLGDQNFIEVK